MVVTVKEFLDGFIQRLRKPDGKAGTARRGTRRIAPLRAATIAPLADRTGSASRSATMNYRPDLAYNQWVAAEALPSRFLRNDTGKSLAHDGGGDSLIWPSGVAAILRVRRSVKEVGGSARLKLDF